jgi:tRNA threonylcarbamoyladenosine biosynthesis protein TsaB
MKVLGINTSTVFGSVGLVDNGRVLGEYSLNLPITHSERLMASIDRILSDTKVPLDEIELFSVALGPGSFTGLRIGVSTVKGLAFGTGRPVVGISTLEALAYGVGNAGGEICPILDARKQEVYTARFQAASAGRLKRLTPDLVISPKDLAKQIDGPVIFVGDGLESYGRFLKRRLGRLASFTPPDLGYVHGTVVARLGAGIFKRGKTLDPSSLVPTYIRRSEAEMKYEEKTRRKQ